MRNKFECALKSALKTEFKNSSMHRAFITTLSFVFAFSLTSQANVAFANDNEGFSTPKRFSAGIDVNPKPRTEETGLPLYPGAIVERDDGEDVNGVNLDLWFGSYGMKLVVVKLKTEDSAEKVEAFYRNVLAERGELLDCGYAATEARKANSTIASRRAERKSNLLTCDEMKIGKNDSRDGKFYKVGTRAKQYGAAIQANGRGATFQLLHFVKRGGEE